jgi:hypothetical protein
MVVGDSSVRFEEDAHRPHAAVSPGIPLFSRISPVSAWHASLVAVHTVVTPPPFRAVAAPPSGIPGPACALWGPRRRSLSHTFGEGLTESVITILVSSLTGSVRRKKASFSPGKNAFPPVRPGASAPRSPFGVAPRGRPERVRHAGQGVPPRVCIGRCQATVSSRSHGVVWRASPPTDPLATRGDSGPPGVCGSRDPAGASLWLPARVASGRGGGCFASASGSLADSTIRPSCSRPRRPRSPGFHSSRSYRGMPGVSFVP